MLLAVLKKVTRRHCLEITAKKVFPDCFLSIPPNHSEKCHIFGTKIGQKLVQNWYKNDPKMVQIDPKRPKLIEKGS